MPTEAEWEFAARGGKDSKGYIYSGGNNIEEVAWYKNNANGKPQVVGLKSENELGIHDMSGNVREWCQDWKDIYPSGILNNPIGPNSGGFRVLRGGCWNSHPNNCWVARRLGSVPEGRTGCIGFRLARSISF